MARNHLHLGDIGQNSPAARGKRKKLSMSKCLLQFHNILGWHIVPVKYSWLFVDRRISQQCCISMKHFGHTILLPPGHFWSFSTRLKTENLYFNSSIGLISEEENHEC